MTEYANTYTCSKCTILFTIQCNFLVQPGNYVNSPLFYCLCNIIMDFINKLTQITTASLQLSSSQVRLNCLLSHQICWRIIVSSQNNFLTQQKLKIPWHIMQKKSLIFLRRPKIRCFLNIQHTGMKQRKGIKIKRIIKLWKHEPNKISFAIVYMKNTFKYSTLSSCHY